MATPLNLALSNGEFFDLGTLLIVLIAIACTAIFVLFTADPTQDKLDLTNIKLDYIQASNQEIIKLIKNKL